MQESRLLRDAFAGIVRDEDFFDLPVTQSQPVFPPPHIQAMLRDMIAAVENGEAVKLFHCKPNGFDSWACLELTPNANGVLVQWYTDFDGVVEECRPAYGPWLFEEGEEFIVTSLFRQIRRMHATLSAIHWRLRTPLQLESELLVACGLRDVDEED